MKRAHPVFPPLSEATPMSARTELAKARFYLSGHEPDEALGVLGTIVRRYCRLYRAACLMDDDDISGRVWTAVTESGLLAAHSEDTIGNVISGAYAAAEAQPSDGGRKTKGAISAVAYQCVDPATIPVRDRLYGNLLIRQFVTATVAPGGVGKSSLIAAETLAQVSAKPLLGISVPKPLRVWLWNLEDPLVETQRKVEATRKYYRLTSDDIGQRMFINSGRDTPLVIARATKNGAAIIEPVIESLIDECMQNSIDIIVIDPFVSCHEVPENDNTMQDMVIKKWGFVADRAGCAVHLVDHTRKMTGVETEVTTDSSRGGKAKTDGCRVVRVVNRMTEKQADDAGVENHRLYFRTYNDKDNLAPPADASDWYKLESVDLGNAPARGLGASDSIGVVVSWKYPNPLDDVTGGDFDRVARVIRAGRWRENVQAKDWVGHAIGKALGIDTDDAKGKGKAKGLVRSWLKLGALIVVDGEDDKRNRRKFVEVKEDDE